MTKPITLYTKSACSHCARAKSLFERLSLSYTEVSVDSDPSAIEEMIERTQGQRTVPQIFIGKQWVGGADALWDLEKSGALKKMIAS